ncbi:DUF4129 domain-containing protein [Chloroflexota bacterium]
MKLDWRQGVLYSTIIGMEGCALYALLTLLNGQVADERLSIIGFMLLYPVAFIFNKLLRWLRWPRAYGYALNVLAWGIGILFMVKAQLFGHLALSDSTWLLALPQAIAHIFRTFEPELLILLGGAALWWTGRRLARVQISFTIAVSEFQFGLAVVLIVFFVAAQLGAQLVNSIPIALAFFFSALLGMSIAHAREGTSWLAGLHQGHWSGLLLVSISLILILGLLIGSLVTPDFLQLILNALKWLWDMIMKAVAYLLSLLPEPGPAEPLPGTTPLPEIQPSEEFKGWTIPEPLRTGFRIGWNILVIGFILAALWRISSQIFGWLRRKLKTVAGAEFEPMPGAFRADILGLLKRILLRLLGFRLPLRRQRESELHEIASVRLIYRHLLLWMGARGWARPAFQTPYEYLGTLEGLLPVSRDALRFITQHYVSARYGLFSPSDEDLHRLKHEWHQVRQNRLKRPDSETDNPHSLGGTNG